MDTPVVTSKIFSKVEGKFKFFLFKIDNFFINLEKEMYSKNREIKEEQGDEEPLLNFNK